MSTKKTRVKESHAKIITELHSALDHQNFEKVLELVGNVGTNSELDDIGQSFLLTYHYNFKTRYFEKADFNYCLKFSDMLNKRTAV